MSLKEDLELKENAENKRENHMALGMIFGMLAGSVVMAFLAMIGQIAWGGLSLGIGMLGGMLIGMTIPKKK